MGAVMRKKIVLKSKPKPFAAKLEALNVQARARALKQTPAWKRWKGERPALSNDQHVRAKHPRTRTTDHLIIQREQMSSVIDRYIHDCENTPDEAVLLDRFHRASDVLRFTMLLLEEGFK